MYKIIPLDEKISDIRRLYRFYKNDGFNVLMDFEKCLYIFVASFPQNNGGWGVCGVGGGGNLLNPLEFFVVMSIFLK